MSSFVSEPAENAIEATQILQWKLHPPRKAVALLPRPRLFRQLDELSRYPLALISAPAGYGKSVLARDWAAQQEGPIAWLSLDERDSDLRQFLGCLIACVNVVLPETCPSVREALAAPELPSTDMLTNLLLNDLESIQGTWLIVLDDYHCIDAQSPVHEVLGTLLQHPPGDLHLLMLTRHDPPLPLATLRGQGAMLELRLNDLRFSDAEATDFLATAGFPEISTSAVTGVLRELEGWAAGLRLLALSLRNVQEVDGFLKRLQGGLSNIQDYLLEEVLNGQPPEIRKWLLRVSLLDRFCAPLIVALGDLRPPQRAEAFLSLLQRQNLFTINVDPQNRWFRFHHLFQMLLRERLQMEVPGKEITELQLRASDWFEREGIIGDAIHYALAAGDPDRAADIFERYRRGARDSADWQSLTIFLKMLPLEIIQKRPLLLIHMAWTVHEDFRLGGVSELLTRAKRLLDEGAADPAAGAELLYLLSLERFWAGEGERALEMLQQAAQDSPSSHRMLQGEVALHKSLACQMMGRQEAALQEIEANRHRLGFIDDFVFQTRVDSAEVFVRLLVGELEAATIAARQMEIGAENGGHIYEICWARYLKANADLQRGDLAVARAGFTFVAEKRHVLHRKAAMDALSGLAITQQLLGQQDQADTTLDTMRRYAADTTVREHLDAADSCAARLFVLRSDVESALVWGHGHTASIDPSKTFCWICVPALNKVKVLLSNAAPEDLRLAEALLETLGEQARALHNVYQGIQIQVLQSMLLEKQSRRDEALASLASIVEVAHKGAWVLPFIEAGPVMTDLLAQLDLPAGEKLLQRVAKASNAHSRVHDEEGVASRSPSPVSTDGAAYLEAMTNREMDILELLAKRLQNKEIAGRLFISGHTVNDHLKHIYQKLSVGNRRQAVRKAADLGLIDA